MTLLALPLVLLILVDTVICHYSKLFFFPLMVLIGWRYIERPSAGRGAIVALVTALGFLYRHDYGLYLGVGSVAACALARVAVPASRRWRSLVMDIAANAAVLIVVLGPWALVVHANEGFVEYTQSRVDQFQQTRGWVYRSLLEINPWRTLAPESPGRRVAVLSWYDDVDPERRRQLEREFGLRIAGEPVRGHRWRYEVAGPSAVRELIQRAAVHDVEGIDARSVPLLRWRFPVRENAMLWLQQMALLPPVTLRLGAVAHYRRSRRDQAMAAIDAARTAFAGLFLMVVCSARGAVARAPAAPVSAVCGLDD